MAAEHAEDWTAPGYCVCGRWARQRVIRSGPGKGAILDGCPGLAAVEKGLPVPALEPIVWTLMPEEPRPWRR